MDDKRDRWSPMIDASHPMEVRTGAAHDAYATAMEMVGNRHSKGALVDLVCWLVQRADMAEDQLREARLMPAATSADGGGVQPTRKPVAWRVRFHTDASLAGGQNVRPWMLTDKEPPVSDDIEVEPLYTADGVQGTSK